MSILKKAALNQIFGLVSDLGGYTPPYTKRRHIACLIIACHDCIDCSLEALILEGHHIVQ